MNVLTILAFFIQTVICEYDRRIITTLKYSKYSITPSVVNGKPAIEGQFPFLVSLKEPIQRMEPNKRVWKNLCGGSIISDTKVLTAAHCFEGNNFYFAKNPNILRAVAGDLRTDLIHTGEVETSETVQWRVVQRVHIHSLFSFPLHDICLAVVEDKWIFNGRVNFIRIARNPIDYAHQCVSAGYGRIGHTLKDTISPVLLTAHIATLPKWRCSLVWEMKMDTFICTDSLISDVARGDSGGPLVCVNTGDSNELNNEGILAGVVSGKNFDKTTLYTRVSEYAKWIDYNGADKLRMTVLVILSIILIVLIYLLFYCLRLRPRVFWLSPQR